MPEFCNCGAQLPPDSLFCHKCGKPQRDVIAPEPEPESVVEFVPPPAAPAAAGPQPPALTFHNLVAVRIAFVVAPVAFLLLGLPALSVLLWVAAGFLAVCFQRRRTGVLLNVRAGVRLGWITGVLMFAITTVIFTLTVVPAVANGGRHALLAVRLYHPAEQGWRRPRRQIRQPESVEKDIQPPMNADKHKTVLSAFIGVYRRP